MPELPVQLPPETPPEQTAIAKRVGLAGVVSLKELGAPAITQRLAPVVPTTMSLTFDHRVVNGGGAAMFMQDLRKAMETFQLPARD